MKIRRIGKGFYICKLSRTLGTSSTCVHSKIFIFKPKFHQFERSQVQSDQASYYYSRRSVNNQKRTGVE